MKKRVLSLISLMLALIMLASLFAACGGGDKATETDGIETDSSTESATDTERENESGSKAESATESDTEKETEGDTETHPPLLDCDNAELIELADRLANGVNVFYPSSSRRDIIIENKNMSLSYAISTEYPQQVSFIKNKNDKSFIENSLDVYVKTAAGDTLFASASTAAATTNIRRMGYYYYDVRVEGQNFITGYDVKEEIKVPMSVIKQKDVSNLSVNNGIITLTVDGNDPYIQLSAKNARLDEFNYISVTMMSTYTATATSHLIYAKTDKMKGFSQDAIESFRLIGDGLQHEYLIPLSAFKEYGDKLTDIRLDFDGVLVGTEYEITAVKLLSVDTSSYPTDIYLNRSFHVYSDKLHQVAQISTAKETEGITEIGFFTKLPEESVKALVIKDKNGLHKSPDGIDQSSIEFVGFDIDGAGVLGFINPAGEYQGKMTLQLSNGEYILTQSYAPKDGRLIPSVANTGNANDFYMGQRVYTSPSHDLDAFVLEAEIERNPLTSANITVNDGSSFATLLGYDTLRGCYHVDMQGSPNFNIPYYQSPNKHYIADLTFKGDNYDRQIYLMAATKMGWLESAVLLDENKMLLPVPMEVTKNFSEATGGEKTIFNLDDAMYGEAIMPLVIGENETLRYTVAHLYQNWGRYPLKQISSIQSVSPYYHLSTGVTESNCITPYYVTSRAPLENKNLNTLPDHRAASAPLWTSQPQHTLGGIHYFLQYTDAEGSFNASEVRRNVIDSYGPTYADVTMDYLSYDGKIKVSYTHMEFPQTDENRTYYTMEYEVLDEVNIKDFRNDFTFYSCIENRTGSNYTQVGYLDAQNKSQVVAANTSGKAVSYILGNNCPYFDYFNIPDYTNENGYVNLAFLIYNSSFVIGGKECKAPFILTDHNKELFLSLDLGEVTLKRGDRFTINAILLPWGSEESVYDGSNGKAPDQNVRDVRDNTLLDPLKATALENCSVIESVFVPKLRSTDGKSATFTLSGGENNVAVRVYGFDRLTVPVIYEKQGGQWVEYKVSSADAPDTQSNAHPYDGYTVHYDGDGTFSYSFVTSLQGDQERTFRIVAEKPFEGWPETEDEGNAKGIHLSAEKIDTAAENSRGVGSHALMTEGDLSFARIYGNDKDGEGFLIPYSASESRESGAFLYLKYRIPKSNKEGAGTFEFYVSTQNNVPAAADKLTCTKVAKDGEWHLVVIDVSAEGHPTYKPTDGKYYAKYLRLDFFNQRMSTSSYVDVAYFGTATDLESISAMETELETLSLIKGGNNETVISVATGEIVSGGDDPYAEVVFVDPSSGYKVSTLLYASCLDMINGRGEDGASRLINRGGSSKNGIDIFAYDITTVNGSQLIFSGWTVIEGGAKDYVYSCDGGKTWTSLTLANGLEKIKDGSDAHLSAASTRAGGAKFTDTVNSVKYCVYQGTEGTGDKATGLAADLSAYAGQKVAVIFAAVPTNAPETLCLIAYLPNVTVE